MVDWLGKPWVAKKKRNAVQSKVLDMGSASEQEWTELQAVKVELLERSCMLNEEWESLRIERAQLGKDAQECRMKRGVVKGEQPAVEPKETPSQLRAAKTEDN